MGTVTPGQCSPSSPSEELTVGPKALSWHLSPLLAREPDWDSFLQPALFWEPDWDSFVVPVVILEPEWDSFLVLEWESFLEPE